jgi:hypothetical protein
MDGVRNTRAVVAANGADRAARPVAARFANRRAPAAGVAAIGTRYRWRANR